MTMVCSVSIGEGVTVDKEGSKAIIHSKRIEVNKIGQYSNGEDSMENGVACITPLTPNTSA